MLGAFGAGLVDLGRQGRIERVGAASAEEVASIRGTLSAEDAQVLADALLSKADALVTHDAELLELCQAGITIIAPIHRVWTPTDPRWTQPGRLEFSFVGSFHPHWGTEVMRGSQQEFYMFEIAKHVRVYYDCGAEAFKARWRTDNGAAGGLHLPAVVSTRAWTFIAFTQDVREVTLFAEGRTAGAQIQLGPVPRTTFHPFQSAAGTHQIDGAVQFKLSNKRLRVGQLQRLYRARSIHLADGELALIRLTERHPLIFRP
jgi:hypothetical protein